MPLTDVTLKALNPPRVSTLLSLAVRTALARAPELHQQWIRQSFQLAHLLSGVNMLINELQNCGSLDLTIRALEDEHPPQAMSDADVEFLSHHWQVMLSSKWVGKAYQIVWLLSKRKFKGNWPELDALLYDLELLRVPLEKHEIAKDRDLKGAPLQFERYPPNGDATDYGEYHDGDPGRSHIMPIGVSDRGSVMWCAIDVRGRQQRWLERRDLADRLLSLAPPAPPAP